MNFFTSHNGQAGPLGPGRYNGWMNDRVEWELVADRTGLPYLKGRGGQPCGPGLGKVFSVED